MLIRKELYFSYELCKMERYSCPFVLPRLPSHVPESPSGHPGQSEQADLMKACGRLHASYSIAEVGGPLLGGRLIIVHSLPMLLLIDAFSFLISAISLMLIPPSFNIATVGKQAPTSLRQDIL